MDLLYARWQMGLSLAFHIVFAVIGMAMPVMMVAAEVAWLRTGRSEFLDLARRWSRGVAVLFAVGVDVDPFAAMFNPAAGAQVLHMLLAACAAVGVGVAGIHARLLLRDRGAVFHRRAFGRRLHAHAVRVSRRCVPDASVPEQRFVT